jgi:hypothetical protein
MRTHACMPHAWARPLGPCRAAHALGHPHMHPADCCGHQTCHQASHPHSTALNFSRTGPSVTQNVRSPGPHPPASVP